MGTVWGTERGESKVQTHTGAGPGKGVRQDPMDWIRIQEVQREWRGQREGKTRRFMQRGEVKRNEKLHAEGNAELGGDTMEWRRKNKQR